MTKTPPSPGTSSGPLSEMTVVDISQQLPGPYASRLLAALGARVIKVEPPGGDPSRRLDPLMFALANSGKEIVQLDLKKAPEVEALHELVGAADVFIEGFRPGVASRLGASWETMSALNPRLVYCSISASGQEGPYSRAPMHDLNLQGLAGFNPGRGIGVPWVDLGTAAMAALGIISYWQEARFTGQGCHLDSAMLDTAVLWARVKASAHGRTEPTYGIFPTSEGRQIAVAILEDHIWLRLCEAFGWDDWRDDPALGAYSQRVDAAADIQLRLADACETRTFDELLDLAERHDLPMTPAGEHLGSAASAQLSARGLEISEAGSPASRAVPLPKLTEHADRPIDEWVPASTATLRPAGARRWRIAVINGPNMPNLGRRDEAIYGPIRSIADLERYVESFADRIGVEVVQVSSNHEGEILDFIHGIASDTDAFVINPAGLTTYGEATRHALADTGHPYVEVHFANTARHFDAVAQAGQTLTSRFTYSAAGLVMGLRQHGYLGALLALSLSLDDQAFLGVSKRAGEEEANG